ncbi:MAG: VWA domain-containing protein, partial [Bdellovibrionales bacterium]|nr:VWA domain-containing protein [Bdellovibrionales bacterium]
RSFGRRYRKKKDLISGSDNNRNQRSKVQQVSLWKSKVPEYGSTEFFPPEQFGGELDAMDDGWLELSSSSAWDVAVRYHELKSRPSFDRVGSHLRLISAQAILERARNVLGSVVHPSDARRGPLDELPLSAQSVELDLEETLENAPGLVQQGFGDRSDLWMEYSVRRQQPVVLAVDTSLSMTGEKLALTAVALSVVLLQFPEDPIGIVAFENQAKLLKDPFERIGVFQLIERFLDVPAQGYTHLEGGVRLALEMCGKVGDKRAGRPPATLLLTDGKYTAGKDPTYLAPRFHQLSVLKMGDERSSFPLCRDMARKGRGVLREVPHLEVLPMVMYSVVKDLLRGRK